MAERKTTDPGEEHSLSEVLDRLGEAGDDGRVRANDVLDIFSDRSLGVLLGLFGLIAGLPMVGAIPGMSILTGTLVLLAIARATFGRGALHLPGKLGGKTMDRGKFQRALEKSRPFVEKVDRVLTRRLVFLTEGRLQRTAISLAAALLAVSMYPLALVPWGVQAPAAGIVAFGLALMARDGLFALLGYAMVAVTLYLVLTFV